ncbi:MAG: hypothetical protein JO270_21200 [Acidobacteriaceae bacterium]|nr:hypothetical protein [Acidobacteriaceae bacterium]
MSTNTAALPKITPSASAERRWCAGFFLVGVLLGLPGSLLVTWQYHIEARPETIGLHFLALDVGYVCCAFGAQRVLHRSRPWAIGSVSAVLAAGSLFCLSLVAPPVADGWRMAALGLLGGAAGALLASLLYGLEPEFSASPGPVTNRASILFGSGCLVSTVAVAATYFTGWPPAPTLILGAVGLPFAGLVPRDRLTKNEPDTMRRPDAPHESVKDLRSIAAVLFTLLLFFQFGNEWAIAGWLPLFLIHRLGTNPVWAICALTAYFGALILGRLIAQAVLPRLRHSSLMVAAMGTAAAGCVSLSLTNTFAGAVTAVVIVGAAFALMFPFIGERLDDRFSYHPGFYSNASSIAISGAMCVPWLLGYMAAWSGLRYVMFVPAAGSIVVLILALLIVLEAHLMNANDQAKAPSGRSV